MNKNIKKCAHCGNTNCITHYDENIKLGSVVCCKCSACIMGDTVEEAIEKWNKRFIEINIKHI